MANVDLKKAKRVASFEAVLARYNVKLHKKGQKLRARPATPATRRNAFLCDILASGPAGADGTPR